MLKQHSSLLKDDVDCHHLFQLCLLRMLPHVWVKIIPSSPCDVENFAFSIGQRWEIVQNLLLECKYLYRYSDTVRICLDKFKELETQSNDGIKIHIGSMHRKGEKKVYYICRDEPIFQSPKIQYKNVLIMQV